MRIRRRITLGPLADEIFRRTEAGMRAGIARLRAGRYEKQLAMEIAGVAEPQTIALAVTIRGDELTADFTGTAPQVRRPVNSPINYTRAYVAVPLKMVCDPERPNNEGTYRPLTVTAPEGCLVNPAYPAACFWRLAAGMLVSELMFRILAEIAPDRVPADSGSMPTWQFYVNGTKRGGEAFALHQHAFGGMGGRPGADGLAAVSFPYNVRDVSIEWAELETPILFERRELIPDSGGAGRWRGGPGEELALSAFDDGRLDPDAPVVLSGSAGRMRFAPAGLFGGLSITPVHLLGIFWVVATCLVLGRAARRLTGDDLAAACAPWLALLASQCEVPSVSNELLMSLPAAGALFFYVRAETGGTRGDQLLAGLCIGCASLIRQQAGILLAAFGLALCWDALRKRDVRGLLRPGALAVNRSSLA